MSDIEIKPFRRANFFNGLSASPQFWNEIQDYHFEKEQFYNRYYHGPGIIPGFMGAVEG
jgi:hypothetical protein